MSYNMLDPNYQEPTELLKAMASWNMGPKLPRPPVSDEPKGYVVRKIPAKLIPLSDIHISVTTPKSEDLGKHIRLMIEKPRTSRPGASAPIELTWSPTLDLGPNVAS